MPPPRSSTGLGFRFGGGGIFRRLTSTGSQCGPIQGAILAQGTQGISPLDHLLDRRGMFSEGLWSWCRSRLGEELLRVDGARRNSSMVHGAIHGSQALARWNHRNCAPDYVGLIQGSDIDRLRSAWNLALREILRRNYYQHAPHLNACHHRLEV